MTALDDYLSTSGQKSHSPVRNRKTLQDISQENGQIED